MTPKETKVVREAIVDMFEASSNSDRHAIRRNLTALLGKPALKAFDAATLSAQEDQLASMRRRGLIK